MFCDAESLGPTLMSCVDKRHVTSLNDVILRQTGVVRVCDANSASAKMSASRNIAH